MFQPLQKSKHIVEENDGQPIRSPLDSTNREGGFQAAATSDACLGMCTIQKIYTQVNVSYGFAEE